MNAQAYRPSHQGHPTPAAAEKLWKVRTYVRGEYVGEYEFETEALAVRYAELSRRTLGVLGCSYRVTGPDCVRWSPR